jgi:iron complex outermembrane receptor protein
MPLRSSLSWGWLTCSLALLTPLTAVAQAAQELVVQSGRIGQRAFDAPASVTVVDGEAIRDAGPQVNLSEALARVPGVVALNRNNYAQDVQISIRGFGSRAAFGLRGIRLITDGIPATTPDGQGQASTVSLTSAERIEVLSGPLAQLYGNSSGGVIQTFTREAGPMPQADVSATFGSDGLQRHDVQLSGRSGAVGLVADYSHFETEGYRANSAAQRKQFNSVLTYDLQPGTRLKLVANVFDMPYAQDPLGLTASQWQADPQQAGKNAVLHQTRKSVQQSQLGAVLDHQFSQNLQLQWRAYTGTRQNLQYQAGSNAALPQQGSWVGLDRNFDGMGLQLRGKQRDLPGGHIDWTVGTDLDQSAEQRQGGITVSGEKSGAPNRNELNKSSNRDAYAQVNWHVQDGQAHTPFTLTAGWRHSDVRLQSRDDYLTDGQNGSGQARYRAGSPVLGLTWHAQDALNVYANWGRGFETPTLAEAAYAVTGSGSSRSLRGLFNPDLLAARSRHLETGFKWTPRPGAKLDAALFHISTDNEIVASLSESGRTAFVNASRTTRQGAELSWQQLWSPQWRSLLSASWLQAQYDGAFTSTSKVGSTYTDKTVPAGRQLPGIPEQQLFASLQWAERGHAAPSPLGLSASIDWVARSALWASDVNDAVSRAPGYGLLNARVRHRSQWQSVRVESWVGVDNLMDRRHVGSVIVNQASAQYFEPGLPRNWAGGVKLSIPL